MLFQIQWSVLLPDDKLCPYFTAKLEAVTQC